MYTALGFIVWATVWSALPVKLVAISGTVYVLVAALKKIFPAISGPWSMLLNVLFSTASVLMVAKPGDLANPAFWASLMITVAGASGIHGTVKAATEPADVPSPSTLPQPQVAMKGGTGMTGNSSSMTSKLPMLFVAAILCMSLQGCAHTVTAPPPGAVNAIDGNANLVLQPIHAFLLSVSTDVQSGKLTLTATQREVLDTANKAANTADAAEIAYHNGGGGDASVLNAALAAVQSAFAAVQASLAAKP